MSNCNPTGGPQFREALSCLEEVVRDGVKHGFFSCTVTCDIGKGQHRKVTIRNGKSRQFTIPLDELPE